jgi:hypothetical protein
MEGRKREIWLGQQAHRPCQVLHHGQGQLRISGYRLGGQLPVDGDQLTGGEGHGGGDPGELVKKGRLAEQAARRINIQYPLRSIGGLDIAFDPAAFQIVEAGRFGVLKVNEVAGRAPDGGAAQGEGSPQLGRKIQGEIHR